MKHRQSNVKMVASRLRRKLNDSKKKSIVVNSKAVPAVNGYPVDMATNCYKRPQTLVTLSLGIITADRDGEPTINNTIRSIRSAGFTQPVNVFTSAKRVTDASITAADTNTTVHRDNSVIGCVPNWTRAADWLLKNTDTSWIMIMQDDIAWCRQGHDILQYSMRAIDNQKRGILRGRLGMLSPYTSPAMVPPKVGGVGWTEARFHGKTTGLWGALAMCFPRESLKAVLKSDRFKSHKSHRALDYIVGDTLRSYMQPPLEVKVHIPSLVDHTGDHSTIYKPSATKHNANLQKLRRGYKFRGDIV